MRMAATQHSASGRHKLAACGDPHGISDGPRGPGEAVLRCHGGGGHVDGVEELEVQEEKGGAVGRDAVDARVAGPVRDLHDGDGVALQGRG